jgi:glutathionyl-hydroquinone reductase
MAYVASGGEFNRDTKYITTRITADGRDGYPVEPDRYRLVVARACPWANRTIIVRRLLGLEDVLPIGFCGPTHDDLSWTFDLDPGGVDPVLKIHYLRDAYLKRFPDYEKGITVPAIVDVPTGEVVTNDFPQITLDFSSVRAPRSCTPKICATRSTRSPSASTPRSTTACTGAGSPGRRSPTTRPTAGCSPRSTGSKNG